MDYIGKTIAGYKIIREIGRGGMGVVYFAEHQVLKDRAPVAIKVLHRHLSQTGNIRQRFQREAKIQERLSHPNLVKLLEYLEEGEDSYIIMEYFKSQSLSEIIGKKVGPMPAIKTGPIFKQILEGIKYAHENEIIHRDIKPSNILLGENDEIKITDFGIAKDIGETKKDEFQTQYTKTGTVIGSVSYMSPEQVHGQNAGKSADIYSLGVTLYEMLAGRVPFDDESDYKVMNAHVNQKPDSPKKYYPHIPNSLVGVVLKAMSKKQADRFKTCDAFLKALEKIKLKEDDSPNYRKRLVISSVALALLGIIWWGYQPTRSGATSDRIDITNPGYNTSWTVGGTNDIKWTTDSRTGSVKIELYKDGKRKTSINNSSKNDGLEKWSIPSRIQSGSNYKIKITSNSDSKINDYSLPFSIQPYTTSKTSSTKSAEDYFNEGYDHYIDKKYNKVITSMSKAIEIDNTHSSTYHYRGYSYYYLKNYGDAKSDFDSCIALNDRRHKGHCYNGRGMIDFIVNENYASAIGEFYQAVRYNPDSGQYYYNRARAYQELNNKIKACDDFRDASKLDHSEAKQSIINYCN